MIYEVHSQGLGQLCLKQNDTAMLGQGQSAKHFLSHARGNIHVPESWYARPTFTGETKLFFVGL